MESKVRSIIETASDKTLSEHIVNSYMEVERNYFLQSWKTSELDAGHFVESVRRLIELKLHGNYTPINKSLPAFNDSTMLSYINTQGDDSYRIHIPRILISIYGIRNKRGVGHISKISPNHLDATFILSSVKWVLAEIVRLNSSHKPEETLKIVERIINRSIEGFWEQDDIKRILVDGLNLQEKIIFILYATNEVEDQKILSIIECKNKSYFNKTLKKLHNSRLIEHKGNGDCIISPKGIAYAKDIILNKVIA
ncbi:hypothetical protein EUZ85_28630 [Hahella sp. KA22]|uniref:hypothetical protein n=1 Tax=Hahella sp. KA22 TaxID=1628392 RepID=UPI000FDD495D|nr:hypothetical protein [Hahella sp. KA22]AZZ94463.1 hypothetical protein ENC22_26045 [Hahella sp. KA22]QAY57836.1 hypothetical protein EUZ85_28630 [Hahella sp. KA22]